MGPKASNVHVVVMAGGSGTRFWPVSRRTHPKQLLALTGAQTLLAQSFRRVAKLAPPARQWMVVGQSHAEACAQAVPEVPREHVLVEPCARNTAAAIALAALHVRRVDPSAVLVVLPADHFVGDPKALMEALGRAVELASSGPIVTLGIHPTRPETGYGYVERGAADARVPGAYAVARFREKPKQELARELVDSGRCYWNAGIFVLRADRFEAEVARSMPPLAAAMRSLETQVGTAGYTSALAAAYEPLASVSVDYGIMEKAREVAVVPVSCGWSDVGSWSAMMEVGQADARGNVTQGRAVLVDTRDSVVYAEAGHVVGVVGLSNVVVVHTRDATLVLPAERAQEVRAVIEGLTANGWSEYL